MVHHASRVVTTWGGRGNFLSLIRRASLRGSRKCEKTDMPRQLCSTVPLHPTEALVCKSTRSKVVYRLQFGCANEMITFGRCAVNGKSEIINRVWMKVIFGPAARDCDVEDRDHPPGHGLDPMYMYHNTSTYLLTNLSWLIVNLLTFFVSNFSYCSFG